MGERDGERMRGRERGERVLTVEEWVDKQRESI